MDNVLIIGTSLSPKSRSQVMARMFADSLTERGVPVRLIDLREHEVPLAGTAGCWEHPTTAMLNEAIGAASHIVLAVPIYCFDVNAAAKSILELAGRAFTEKVVGFICSAGGQGSYMSVMGLANHLMLDFRSVIVPRFLYASKGDWSEEGELSAEITGRMQLLHDDLARVTVVPSESD